MVFSKIIGTGSYLPEKIVSNYDLEKTVETTHAWIFERTGIVERRIASQKETTTYMGAQASKQALEFAGISAQEIDLVLVATCTPDLVFPATACMIQKELNMKTCPAFDIQAACSGFIYALSTADQFIRTGTVKNVLLVGVEMMSRIVDWKDRKTCVLFGDGAGACVLQASNEPGIICSDLGADGKQHELLYLQNHPVGVLNMQGNAVFRSAVHFLGNLASDTLSKQGMSVANLDWLVPHQANMRIIQATAEKLGLPMERVVTTLHKHGNTSAASIPLALDEYVREGKIVKGQHLLLEAFGGGLTWGSALIKY